MAALVWIQHLEDERDKADQVANFSAFKAITDEISATIAGKYGISERLATQEEQIAIIHSITRTRHRFMGQRNMLHYRYLGYDRAKTNSLLQTDALFKDHMAAVLAIDAMVMKAVNDDDFEELWRQENASKAVSADFVSAVIDHAKSHEKKEVFESLQPSFQGFLQDRHDVIHLANDVFNSLTHKTSLERDVKPNHSLIFRIMSGDIGSIMFEMLSVQDAITYAISTTETYRSLPIWNNIRQACFPKLNTAYIRGYGAGNPEGLRMAIFISRYAYSHFHTLFVNRQFLVDNIGLTSRLRVSYAPIFIKALCGCALMATGSYAEALMSFSQAGDAVSLEARYTLAYEASNSDHIHRAFNAATGRSYLEDRMINHEDKDAQSLTTRRIF
jgi:hypothetical protein